jgi:hypothetical protein
VVCNIPVACNRASADFIISSPLMTAAPLPPPDAPAPAAPRTAAPTTAAPTTAGPPGPGRAG